jgi:hypothetical protein
MADLEQQLQEDRTLRDAAKGLLKSDLGFVKNGMAQKGLGARVASRAKDGAAEIAENTAGFADDHRAQIGTGIAVAALAVAGWLFRDQLADAIYDLLHDKGLLEEAADKAEQLTEDARSLVD